MHTVAGLLDLGHHDEAVRYLTEISGTAAAVAEDLRDRIASPTLVAMLLAKITIAAERGVTLTVSADSRLGQATADPHALVTIVGNLIDNAVDAVAGVSPARISVALTEQGDRITVVVADTGPGVPPDLVGSVFVDGFSTKPARAGIHRGLGLALVHRLVHRLGGSIAVHNDGGAVFTVTLPSRAGVPAGEVLL
jgi:two-component system CitB family sensor kinase